MLPTQKPKYWSPDHSIEQTINEEGGQTQTHQPQIKNIEEQRIVKKNSIQGIKMP